MGREEEWGRKERGGRRKEEERSVGRAISQTRSKVHTGYFMSDVGFLPSSALFVP